MKPILILLAVVLTLQGCNKDIIRAKSFCNVTNPIQDLPWLKTIIDAQANNKYSKMTIYEYEYQQEEGFLVDSCLNCPDSVAIFYNCSGEKICEFSGKNGSNTCPDFLTNSIKKEIVFQDTIVETTSKLSFIKTELGGCNKSASLQNKSAVIKNDTVGISIENDSISVFVGLNYICCAPFATDCEIKNDSIFLTIKDICSWGITSCYCRCDCYYTFDFKFVKSGNSIYNYQILLFDPRKSGSKLIKEGAINLK